VKVAHVHRMRGIGGSERHLLALLPGLAALGVEPVFVGLDDPAWDPEPFYEQLSVESVRIRMGHELDPRVVGRLHGALRGADIVHTHLVHADVYGALARGDRTLVSTKHNDDPFRAGPFRHVEGALTRRAARVIAITEALKRFNVARVLLAISRLVPQKGLDVAVRALRRVREEEPRAVLVVLGEGPERARLAGEGVYLPGRVGDVSAWLARAELLVHPARWEGFGLALLEAMLAGKPVVATRVSSIPEIVVDGETGLLVPPDDPEALAAAILRVLRDPGRLGEAGLARARSEFSVELMSRRTLAVYDRALSSRDR